MCAVACSRVLSRDWKTFTYQIAKVILTRQVRADDVQAHGDCLVDFLRREESGK